MRKHALLLAAALLCHGLAFSQVDVFTNGSVGVKSTQMTSAIPLSVGDRTYGSDYDVHTSSAIPATGNFNIAAEGTAFSQSAVSARAIGVRGAAGNCTDGWNFGVAGVLQGSGNGAGIYGSATKTLGTSVAGRYAGYFHGDMKATGAAKASWVNPHEHDIYNTSAILNALSFVNSLQTRQGTLQYAILNDDSLNIYPGHKAGQSSGTTHYAFSPLAAYAYHPNQVITDAAGQHYVNYTDIMPVLVEAVKQLYAMVSPSSVNGDATALETGGMAAAPAMKAVPGGTPLLHVDPNPFTKATLVRYALPEDTHDARLRIADMQDTPVREIPLDGSSDRVILSSSGLEPGMYLLTLVINGKDVEKRRMILTN
jgi:hypothetical protein